MNIRYQLTQRDWRRLESAGTQGAPGQWVKDPVLPKLRFRSQLQLGIHMPRQRPKKMKTKQKPQLTQQLI